MIRLHDLETVQATRRELLQREEIAFGKSLLAKGFRNEDDYLSACLPEEERRALQERMRELSRTGFEIGASQDDARFAQEELRSRSLSAAGEPPAGLPDLLERAGTHADSAVGVKNDEGMVASGDADGGTGVETTNTSEPLLVS